MEYLRNQWDNIPVILGNKTTYERFKIALLMKKGKSHRYKYFLAVTEQCQVWAKLS